MISILEWSCSNNFVMHSLIRVASFLAGISTETLDELKLKGRLPSISDSLLRNLLFQSATTRLHAARKVVRYCAISSRNITSSSPHISQAIPLIENHQSIPIYVYKPLWQNSSPKKNQCGPRPTEIGISRGIPLNTLSPL